MGEGARITVVRMLLAPYQLFHNKLGKLTNSLFQHTVAHDTVDAKLSFFLPPLSKEACTMVCQKSREAQANGYDRANSDRMGLHEPTRSMDRILTARNCATRRGGRRERDSGHFFGPERWKGY